MSKTSYSTRIGIALAIWAAGLILFLGLGLWNIASSRQDAENHLISEAGRMAAQIAGMLSLPGSNHDSMSARAIVVAAMEDERIYAIRIQTRQGVMEGQRRNYMWEPVAWDDEIAENCVRGMNPVRIGGKPDGFVEIWLSPRSSKEDAGMLSVRERWRFFAFAMIWTIALGLVFWQWGVFRSWRERLQKRDSSMEAEPELSAGLAGDLDCADEEVSRLVDSHAGHEYQARHPNSWLVTAGLFRQTFAHAPHLINMLYAEGELAGLCHLGRMLEQAAPCIGAGPLMKAAHEMQAALNNPDRASGALPVEECARILEETLAALGCADSGHAAENTGS